MFQSKSLSFFKNASAEFQEIKRLEITEISIVDASETK